MHGTVSKRVEAYPQEALEKYSNETPAQQADHEEIAKRYRRPKRGSARPPTLMPKLRMAELERLYLDRYGSNVFPDDDSGRHDLRLWTDHAAQVGVHYITGRARVLAPWLTDDGLDDVIDRAGRGKHWTADDLGNELNLTDAERTRLDIRTIAPVNRTKAQRMKRNKKRRATAEAQRRAKAGAKPQALSEARTKPWLALGISESTYRRRKRQADSNSCPILLESLSGTNRCQTGDAPVGARVSNGDKARVLVDRVSAILRTHCADPQSETSPLNTRLNLYMSMPARNGFAAPFCRKTAATVTDVERWASNGGR
jgi:hypothetical protein